MAPIVALVLAFSAALPSAEPAAKGAWQRLDSHDGIETFRRGEADGQVEFLGRALVPAPALLTLAALVDQSYATEWVDLCVASRLLAHPGPLRWVAYRRNRAPVPWVADRDMVLDTELAQVGPGQTWRLSFRRRADDAGLPPTPGVVRLTAISGSFTCTQVDAATTVVAYEVAMDPGGRLPLWACQRAAARLPRQTLSGLRRAVRDERLGPLARALAAELEAAGSGEKLPPSRQVP